MSKTTSISSTWNGLQPKELSGLQNDRLNLSLNKRFVDVLQRGIELMPDLFPTFSKSHGTNLVLL
jgi:hypothetical protein